MSPTPQASWTRCTRPPPPMVTCRRHVCWLDLLLGQHGHTALPPIFQNPERAAGGPMAPTLQRGRQRLRTDTEKCLGCSHAPKAASHGQTPQWWGAHHPLGPRPSGRPQVDGLAGLPGPALRPRPFLRREDGKLCLFRLLLKLTARISLIYLK